MAAASAVVAAADVVLVQAEAPPAACLRAAEIAHAAGRTVVFNPAPAPPPAGGLERLLAISDYVLPNETELRALTGETDAERGARRLRRRTRGTVIVTLGERGALLCTAPAAPVEVVAAPKVDVVDTVGAGDAFAGVFAAALAENGSLNVALRRGLAAGALACTRAGALPSMPSRDEILRRTREA